MQRWIKTDFAPIHEQLLHRKREYPFKNIRSQLRQEGITYSYYNLCKKRGRGSKKFFERLHNMGIILDDDVLCKLFPKSQS